MPRSAAAIARRAAKRGTSVAEQAKVDAVAARAAIQKKRQLTREAGGRNRFAEQRRETKGAAASDTTTKKRGKPNPEAMARREAKTNALGLTAVAAAVLAPCSVVSAGSAAFAASAASAATTSVTGKRRKRSPEAMARREAKRIALKLTAVAAAVSALPSAAPVAPNNSAASAAATSDTGKRRKRSPEAMARREAKRIALGLGVASAGFAAGSSKPAAAPTEKQNKRDGEGDKPKREVWTCSKCGFDGIWGTRFRCRECGEPRYDRKKMDRSWVDPKVAGGWKIEQPSSQKLRQNAELREMYKKNPDSMTEEDRNRAEVLIQRSKRKKKKKAKAKAAFLAKKTNLKKQKNGNKKNPGKGPRVNLNLPSSMDR